MATETVMDFLGKVKAFLKGERLSYPARPRCETCYGEVLGPGYRYRGQLFCDVWCCPPFYIHGDPGHA